MASYMRIVRLSSLKVEPNICFASRMSVIGLASGHVISECWPARGTGHGYKTDKRFKTSRLGAATGIDSPAVIVQDEAHCSRQRINAAEIRLPVRCDSSFQITSCNNFGHAVY